MTLNVCQAGHSTHDSKLVDTKYGPFWIWDWERYRGFAGYCPGQDDVSMSLDLYGDWERPDIKRMREILTEKPGLMLDFGSHIGWFGVQAADLGCSVLAYDSDPENVRLFAKNIEGRSFVGRRWSVYTSWIADLDDLGYVPVRFLKADVEGAEDQVIDLTRHLWEDRKIDHALLEVSPVFKPYYPALIDELIGYGYDAWIHKDAGPWHITGTDVTFPQENVHLDRLS